MRLPRVFSAASMGNTCSFRLPRRPIGDCPIGAYPVRHEIGQHDLNPVHWRRAKNGVALIDEIEDRPDYKCDATGPKRYSVRQRKTNSPSWQRHDESLIGTRCRPKNAL